MESAVSDFYAPAAFWMLKLPPRLAAQALSDLYLHPKNPHVHFLMRVAVLLGDEFCKWLEDRWDSKWKGYSQPPSFYWTFKEMRTKMKVTDRRLLAARSALSTRLEVTGEQPVLVGELLQNDQMASTLLSKASMRVFDGNSTMRATARVLDYLAYGRQLIERGGEISQSIIKAIGVRKVGDLVATAVEE